MHIWIQTVKHETINGKGNTPYLFIYDMRRAIQAQDDYTGCVIFQAFRGNNTEVEQYFQPIHKGKGLLSIFFMFFDEPGESWLLALPDVSTIPTTQHKKTVTCPQCTFKLENDTTPLRHTISVAQKMTLIH